MDKISVIIPVYNMEKYLKRCLDSVVNQTYKNLEIIIVDDGSTDSSPQICDNYAEADDRIRVVHKTNGGLSSARNAGIDIATGQYISFIDSDDYIDVKCFEILYSNLINNKADISICDILSTGNDNEKPEYSDMVYNFSRKEALKHLYVDLDLAFVTAPSKLYKTELFTNIRYPNVKKAEDNFTTYKLFINAGNIVFTKNKLYMYFQRSDSLVHTFNETSALDFKAFDEQMCFWEANGYKTVLRCCFVRNFKRLIMTQDCARNNGVTSYDFYDNLYKEYFATAKKHIKNVRISSIEKRLYLLDWRDFREHKLALMYIRIKDGLRNRRFRII